MPEMRWRTECISGIKCHTKFLESNMMQDISYKYTSMLWSSSVAQWLTLRFPNFNEKLSNNWQKETAQDIETNSSLQCSQMHFK